MKMAGSLDTIQPGEWHTYFVGSDLGRCRKSVLDSVAEMHKRGRITLVARRSRPPMFQGRVDYRMGLGEFEYYAVGLHHRVQLVRH